MNPDFELSPDAILRVLMAAISPLDPQKFPGSIGPMLGLRLTFPRSALSQVLQPGVANRNGCRIAVPAISAIPEDTRSALSGVPMGGAQGWSLLGLDRDS